MIDRIDLSTQFLIQNYLDSIKILKSYDKSFVRIFQLAKFVQNLRKNDENRN